METNVFELATRQKFRFATTKGGVGVEDLWDLSLEELDTIAKAINKAVKESSSDESFIKKTTAGNRVLSLRLELVVSIINTKLAEAEKRKTAAERKVKRDNLMALIEQKETDAMGRKSIASLRAELDKLDDGSEEE